MRGIVISGGGGSTEYVAYASMLVSLLVFIFTIYWSRRSERRAHLDDYWFKQLIVPKCIAPVADFHDEWMSKIDSANSSMDRDAITRFISEFQLKRSKLQEGAWISRIFAGNYYDFCCQQLDGVEDALVDSLHKMSTGVLDETRLRADVRLALGSAVVEILANAANIHGGNYRPVRVGPRMSGLNGVLAKFGLSLSRVER